MISAPYLVGVIFIAIVLVSACCPWGTRGRLPWIFVKEAFLQVLAKVISIILRQRGMGAVR